MQSLALQLDAVLAPEPVREAPITLAQQLDACLSSVGGASFEGGRVVETEAAQEREPPYPANVNPEEGRRIVGAEKCRRSLAVFFRRSWSVLEPDTPLSWNWHLQVVCDHVQMMIEEWAKKVANDNYEMRAQNLLINVPPGTAKSRILSVCAPAWAWLDGNWPGLRILCLSANPTVAIRDSLYCKQLIESNWYQDLFQPSWVFSEDQNTKGHFNNSKGGERIAKGIGATITGQRGHVIFLDDLNDVKEAFSDTKRSGINRDVDAGVYSRVADMRSAIRISIQQRVHEEDFTGHSLKKITDGVNEWIHLVLPMEYEIKRACDCGSCVVNGAANDNTPKPNELGFIDPRTKEGEVLHPVRFPAKVLNSYKTTLGDYGYAGQCQQRPSPSDGGMFKWKDWRFWKPDGTKVANEDIAPRPDKCYKGVARALPSTFDEVMITADFAFKGEATSDPVAIFVVARVGADRFIIDCRWERMDFPKSEEALKELSKLYPLAARKLVEDKANGPGIISRLKGEIPGLIAVNPQGGKTSRAHILSPSVASGNWYIKDGAPWVERFCFEFGIFPNGAHDDAVDAISQANIEWQLSPDAVRASMLSVW